VSYTAFARALHWITVGLLVLVFGLGISMTNWVSDEQKVRVYGWHEWVGITIFVLTAIRLWWRLGHPAPPIDLPRWERVTAGAIYVAMYLVLLVQPIVGWLMSTAFGFPVVYLGLVPLPGVVAEDRALAERLEGVHAALAIALAGLFVVHVAGVLFHHLIRRDAVLARMLPSVSGDPSAAARGRGDIE
jgi:cytochrome b561